jgi:hapalindole-type alkaloid chlorinase
MDNKSLWNFIIASAADSEQLSMGIEKLYTREVDGYIIKNFLKSNEIEIALQNLSLLNMNAKGYFTEKGAYTIPRSFSMLEKNKDVNYEGLERYFDEVDEYRSILQKIFSFDFEKRLFKLFTNMENERIIASPAFEWQGKRRLFSSSTIRVCSPELGGIDIHVGNMFKSLYPMFYDFLGKIIDVQNQISYFVVLKKPESGGELILYNAEWKDYKGMLGKDKIRKADGTVALLGDIDRQYIIPDVGDMVLFAGGDIWHSVNNLFGSSPRITIGGFLARSDKDQTLFTWA